MKKDRVTTQICKAIAYVTEKEVERNNSKWPPRCMGFFHQPKRPKINGESV